MPKNIDAFNSITADLLGMLYGLHPQLADFSTEDLSDATKFLIAEAAPTARPPLWWLTGLWLEKEGYIRIGFKPISGERLGMVELTAKGFQALAAVPSSIEGKAKLGDRVQRVVVAAAGEARNAAIGEIIGAVIGAAAKQVVS